MQIYEDFVKRPQRSIDKLICGLFKMLINIWKLSMAASASALATKQVIGSAAIAAFLAKWTGA